jgi:hypothetical protein
MAVSQMQAQFRTGLVGENIFGKMSHRMFHAMLEEVFDTNKKTNYIVCLETAR